MTWELPECQTMSEAVAAMHELYRTALVQGFTKHEAMHLLLQDGCCRRKDRDD